MQHEIDDHTLKKILYVSTHPHLNLAAPSGPGTHMREVIRALKNNGFEVHTLIAGGETIQSSAPSIQFSKKKWKKFIPKFLWESLKELRMIWHNRTMVSEIESAISMIQPDVIYERGYAFMTAASLVSKKNNIPIFIELNAPYPQEIKEMSGAGMFWFFSKKAERKQVEIASQVVVVSSALKDYYKKNYNVSDDKILVTPNAVNLAFSNINLVLKDTLKKDLDGYKIIGFVGSIFPYHGVDKLIKSFAFTRAKLAHLPMKLLIVGDGEILNDLKDLATMLGVGDDVVFTGNVPHQDVSSYISLMDITVIADSKWYCSPVKIFEYGLFGKYVIAPDTQSVRDVMVHQVHGWLLNGSDDDLNNALEFALSHPDECKKAGTLFQEKVKSEYLWSNVGNTIISKIS